MEGNGGRHAWPLDPPKGSKVPFSPTPLPDLAGSCLAEPYLLRAQQDSRQRDRLKLCPRGEKSLISGTSGLSWDHAQEGGTRSRNLA